MTRILVGAIMLSGLVACSGDTGRRPASEAGREPAEVAQRDPELISIEDTIGARVIPEEEQPAPAAAPGRRSEPPAAAPPRTEARPKAAARPEPEPEPAADPAPTVEPQPAASETESTPTSPTAPPAAAEPPPVPAPDTIGTRRPVPARSPAVTVPRPAGSAVTVPAGTAFHAALIDSIHSRHDSVGHTVEAKVMDNVLGPDGRTVIPAGAVVSLTVLELEPAKSRSAADGRLALRVDGITRNGETLAVSAEVQPVPHELKGRGVTGSEAAKVGAGAAAGAIAGRVLGGDARGAVIGGVVGAAGGAAVAAETADRDVVVKAGTPITFVLTAPLVAASL